MEHDLGAFLKTEGIIQDIHDGTICQTLRAAGLFLSCPEHAGLTLCTDGVPVFKLSGLHTAFIIL